MGREVKAGSSLENHCSRRGSEVAEQPLTLADAQAAVDRWIAEYGVRYFPELANLAQLVEEVGELARVMSRSFGPQSVRPGTTLGPLADELADVLFVLVCIANQTGVDLEQAFRDNLRKKTERDAARHRQNPLLT
jgi:NTP pyrophosphatase (non-canonical NTP hydrolase)